MTELEMIDRAKRYPEQLAQGIDPIRGQPVPEGDTLRSERLSRCFSFVAQVLGQVIDNGGTGPAAPQKPKKRPLEIPLDWRAQFAYSDKPISASEIARRVNDLADSDTMQRLTYAGLLAWLTHVGMMAPVRTPDGKETRRPTPQGAQLGISVEERMGRQGPYTAVVYDRAAQQFILDNLDALLDEVNLQLAHLRRAQPAEKAGL